jgi:hypothetical protein
MIDPYSVHTSYLDKREIKLGGELECREVRRNAGLPANKRYVGSVRLSGMVTRYPQSLQYM